MTDLHSNQFPTTITPLEFARLLAVYPSIVPEKLKELEEERLVVIPEKLAGRVREVGDGYLEKEEVVRLVEWKLSHGKFRPSLKALVQSNSPQSITSTTRQAFQLLKSPTKSQDVETILKALDTLTTLRGIGPATASLLLSTLDPVTLPFFSDELYRWLVYDESEAKGKGKGWERKIGYTKGEYRELLGRVGSVRARLGEGGKGVSARDVEMVAWVLGKGYGGQASSNGEGVKEREEEGKNESKAEESKAEGKDEGKGAVYVKKAAENKVEDTAELDAFRKGVEDDKKARAAGGKKRATAEPVKEDGGIATEGPVRRTSKRLRKA